MKKKFEDEHISTLGLDFATKVYETKHDHKSIPVKVWDTAGQERFKTLTFSFYKKADGIIISYDVTDQRTYDGVKNWIESINQHAEKSAARILVGNKIDRTDRVVT